MDVFNEVLMEIGAIIGVTIIGYVVAILRQGLAKIKYGNFQAIALDAVLAAGQYVLKPERRNWVKEKMLKGGIPEALIDSLLESAVAQWKAEWEIKPTKTTKEAA